MEFLSGKIVNKPWTSLDRRKFHFPDPVPSRLGKVSGAKIVIAFVLLGFQLQAISAQTRPYPWPDRRQMALSLTFDDARPSNVDVGAPLFDSFGVKVTFFVVPSAVERKLEKWKEAVASGHEIGNHSLTHPCSGNFPWSRGNALEDFTLERMRSELLESNRRIKELLDVTPSVFAYPCGQKFVGRGVDTRSYVPLVAQLFVLGRGWMDEISNDPQFSDMAQINGIEMDGKDFEDILPILETAKEFGRWVVLVGHEIGESGDQTTRVSMLERLIEYARDPAMGVWLAPVGTVAKFIKSQD